jgi:hypothetical protein
VHHHYLDSGQQDAKRKRGDEARASAAYNNDSFDRLFHWRTFNAAKRAS